METQWKRYYKSGLFIFAGIIALFVPLLRDFHIESAMVASVVGCFWAALRGCYSPRFSGRDDFKPPLIILGYVWLFGLPLLLFALISGCFSWNGVGFWILYPTPGIFLGYAIGRLLQCWNVPFRRAIAVFILLFIAIGVFALEFFHYPQVYFFNQVWGGWPGPIYDETVKVTRSLVFFRGLTLGWIVLLWWLPSFNKSNRAKVIVVFCILLLGLGYSELAPMGIITPPHYLQKQLGGKKETKHFVIYYDKSHYSQHEIGFIAARQEFYYNEIIDTLQIKKEREEKIISYLYAHPWQKKALVGAKFTSYVPVWLDRDQLHIARQQIDGSLKHELVHVLAKRFGNSSIHASWSIGLVEGLAVAITGSESPVTTINQMVVSQKPYPKAAEMRDALLPWGFYGGRSTVNYTQSGSFVQYLLANYPVESFKRAYGCSDIAHSYSVSFDSLIAGWHQALDTVQVDSTDRRVAHRLYGFPSLFEQKCPHVQSAFAQFWDQYQYNMAEEDTAAALGALSRARNEAAGNIFVKNQWAFLSLKAGHQQAVAQQTSLSDSTLDGLLLSADAFALQGRVEVAKHYVEAAAQIIRNKKDVDSLKATALKTRQNKFQWRIYRAITYKGASIDKSTFNKLYERTQIRAIQQAIEHQQLDKMQEYARWEVSHPISDLYFDTCLALINRLAYKREFTLVQKWLNMMQSNKLRLRYQERLDETKQWVKYLKNVTVEKVSRTPPNGSYRDK